MPFEPFRPNLLKNSIFIHMPKTGGTFIREHFNEQPGWFNTLGVGHGNMEDFSLYRDLFAFTFIRNPVDWLVSYWNFYRIVLTRNEAFDFQKAWADKSIAIGFTWTRWIQRGNPIEVLWHENVDVFLERLLEFAPNAPDLAYRHFTYNTDFIGKTENLTEDLIKALELAGEDMDLYSPEIIQSWADDPRNAHEKPEGFQYNVGIMREILGKNPLIMSHYDDSIQV